MTAPPDGERALEFEDADLPEAGRRVCVCAAIVPDELVPEELRLDETEIRARGKIVRREDLGRGEYGIAAL